MKKLLLKIVFSTLTIVNFTGCDSSSSTSLNNYYLDKNNTNSFNEETLNNNILEENRSFTTLDPLFQYQWHLSALRVPEIWEKYTGRGIKVAIVDSGIEKNHPDLIDNLDLNLSYRYSDKSSDPTPDENQLVYLPADSGHGTSCAGIIGAVTNNNLGVAGVAPDVELVGFNTFSSGLDADFEDALGNLNVDISNNSWGGESASILYDDPWSLNGIEQGIKKGRNGKGIIYVFASGNEGGNSNYSILHGSKYILNIGAVTYNAKVPFYSNYGDNILIGAPAGDVDPSSGFGIFTTDLMGEKYGFDGKDSLTKTLKNREDYNGDYTGLMNGTSSATPFVSGIVALMLEANPELTYRDVKYILAKTAKPLNKDLRIYNWEKNGAGIDYSPYYGFGVIYPKKAIEMAETFAGLPEEKIIIKENNEPKDLNINNPEIVTEINIDDNISIEHVKLNIDFFYSSNNIETLRLKIISPSGTTSNILFELRYSLALEGSLRKWSFASLKFLDEHSQGTWKIILDNKNIDGKISGKLYSVGLEISGH